MLSDVRTALSRYKDALQGLSNCELTGAYVYGSVASGCQNPKTSDIDVILVAPCVDDPGFVEELEEVHQQVGLPIDATVVSPEQLRIETVPPPIGFLLKPMWESKAVHCPEGRWCFVVQSQEVLERGLRLFGPEPRDLFHPVPWPLMRRYIDYLLPFIVPRFKNSVLNLCRCAYNASLRKTCSKREAGEWALAEMPAEWHSLIDQALGEYARGDSDQGVERDELLRFEKYVMESVAQTEEGRSC